MRLFIAIDPPDEVSQELAELQFPSRSIRWTNSEQIHLTLAFLGDQPDDQFDPLCEALCEVEFEAFSVKTQDIGCFRHGAIWLGLQPNKALEQLQQRIFRVLQVTGFPLESRRFHAHLTLGRCRHNPASATEILHHRLNHRRFSFDVDRFLLVSSVLRQDGAVHQIEAEFLPC